MKRYNKKKLLNLKNIVNKTVRIITRHQDKLAQMQIKNHSSFAL